MTDDRQPDRPEPTPAKIAAAQAEVRKLLARGERPSPELLALAKAGPECTIPGPRD